MIVLGSILLLFGLGLLVWFKLNDNEFIAITGVIISAFSGIACLVAVSVLFISHLMADSNINNYNELKRTIDVVRSNEVSELERATITEKIIEINQEIASNNYWNETVFDIFIPDKLTKLEPLK
ncbi:hypothetical protein ABNX05_10845 [Lysinibacillus sp. M3]|uniref:Uncharacterized protein n=1 Tax=Lysinibacillus zambalensis TaxID=3160866 RepID=A0ABV1MSL9_9BACI